MLTYRRWLPIAHRFGKKQLRGLVSIPNCTQPPLPAQSIVVVATGPPTRSLRIFARNVFAGFVSQASVAQHDPRQFSFALVLTSLRRFPVPQPTKPDQASPPRLPRRPSACQTARCGLFCCRLKAFWSQRGSAGCASSRCSGNSMKRVQSSSASWIC